MYDAVNRGLRKTRGEILAYLNCDEQYLPGALAEVARFFAAHPEIEVAFAHAVVVDRGGTFHLLPQSHPAAKAAHPGQRESCDPDLRDFFPAQRDRAKADLFRRNQKCIGDGVWVMRLIDAGVGMAILPTFIATFTETGENQISIQRRCRRKPSWSRARRFGPDSCDGRSSCTIDCGNFSRAAIGRRRLTMRSTRRASRRSAPSFTSRIRVFDGSAESCGTRAGSAARAARRKCAALSRDICRTAISARSS